MMVALVLSSNMKRMLKANVLVRKMVGIETAGSINILFTDKTGTLTSGKLNVKKLINFKGEECRNSNYLSLFKEAILYNNQSMISDNKVIGGNTTDQAIMNYLKMDKTMDYEHVVLFNSKKKYSCTKLVNKNIFYFKGANEIIIDNSDFYLDELGYKQLLRNKDKLFDVVNNLTKDGLRVISVAYKNKNSDLGGLCFIGFVVIKDEIRDNANEGIKLVESAGIQTIMITGDDKITASSIGREIGLIKNKSDLIITSDELSKMTDNEIGNII